MTPTSRGEADQYARIAGPSENHFQTPPADETAPTRVHLHQVVHVMPGAVERPTRLNDGPLVYRGDPPRVEAITAVVVGLTADTVWLNSPHFHLEAPEEAARGAVGSQIRPQYAANGVPIWGY